MWILIGNGFDTQVWTGLLSASIAEWTKQNCSVEDHYISDVHDNHLIMLLNRHDKNTTYEFEMTNTLAVMVCSVTYLIIFIKEQRIKIVFMYVNISSKHCLNMNHNNKNNMQIKSDAYTFLD